MSSLPISKKESGTDDLLKLLAEQIRKQKIGLVDTKSLIHLFRPIFESLGVADIEVDTEHQLTFPIKFSLVFGLEKSLLSESLLLGDSMSTLTANRFELEIVDGLHQNETPVKIGFWELMVA